MKTSRKVNIDLEKLAKTLDNLDPETYPDYTSDWPLDELRNAIKEGDESPDSSITSAEDHIKYFRNNPLK